MTHWLPLSLMAVVLWGLWAFLPTVAASSLDPKAVVIYQGAGSLLVLVAIAAFGGARLAGDVRGSTLGVISGVAGGLGSLAFVYALTKGKPSVVLTVTSLYPVVSFALAFLVLGEELTRRKLLSITFAIAAVLLAAG